MTVTYNNRNYEVKILKLYQMYEIENSVDGHNICNEKITHYFLCADFLFNNTTYSMKIFEYMRVIESENIGNLNPIFYIDNPNETNGLEINKECRYPTKSKYLPNDIKVTYYPNKFFEGGSFDVVETSITDEVIKMLKYNSIVNSINFNINYRNDYIENMYNKNIRDFETTDGSV